MNLLFFTFEGRKLQVLCFIGLDGFLLLLIFIFALFRRWGPVTELQSTLSGPVADPQPDPDPVPINCLHSFTPRHPDHTVRVRRPRR